MFREKIFENTNLLRKLDSFFNLTRQQEKNLRIKCAEFKIKQMKLNIVDRVFEEGVIKDIDEYFMNLEKYKEELSEIFSDNDENRYQALQLLILDIAESLSVSELLDYYIVNETPWKGTERKEELTDRFKELYSLGELLLSEDRNEVISKLLSRLQTIEIQFLEVFNQIEDYEQREKIIIFYLLLNNISTLPITAKEALATNIIKKASRGEIFEIGTISCMPKIEVWVDENKIPYFTYDYRGTKTTIEFKAKELNIINWLLSLTKVNFRFKCAIADTEASVKYGDRLFVDKTEIAEIMLKRIGSFFPGEVNLRSELFPLNDDIYTNNFERIFNSIKSKNIMNGLAKNVRFRSRYDYLKEIGVSEEVAISYALQDMVGMDTEYALEGIWMYEKSWCDLFMILDNFPLSASMRQTRELPSDKFPIFYPTEYESL